MSSRHNHALQKCNVKDSLLRYAQGKVVEEFSTLVNPLCHIPEETSAVNHITDDMVKDAPVLEQV